MSRFRGVGLLGLRAGAEIGPGTVPSRERARLTEGMVADGALRRVRVKGVRDERYMLASDERFLRGGPLRTREVAFLAPLDPLVWDRELLRQLFEFDYVWEVYTPKKSRKHGYYVLPLLWGDRLGRPHRAPHRPEGRRAPGAGAAPRAQDDAHRAPGPRGRAAEGPRGAPATVRSGPLERA